MASAEMVVYCFDTLQSHFEGSTEPTLRSSVQQQQYPLFVTWEIEEHGERRLRGCIGTLKPTRLCSLRDFTFKSALRDHRFDPIGPHELQRLCCSVSLLLDYQDAGSYDDWKIGTHGIIIEFTDSRGKEYSATYLPQVACEQGWTHVETVTALMRKAGYRHGVTDAMLEAVRVTRYRSSSHKLTYQQYVSLKQTMLDSA